MSPGGLYNGKLRCFPKLFKDAIIDGTAALRAGGLGFVARILWRAVFSEISLDRQTELDWTFRNSVIF
jgi:hypothetical protein